MKFSFQAPAVPAVAIESSDDVYPIRRIFCVGRNYEAHAREMGVPVDREAPFYFTKSADAFVPSGAAIEYPPGTSNYHYEMELVVALGAPAFRVAPECALDAVFGYACGLDMTRRDLQLAAREQRRPWDLGKDFEQSAVIAPLVPVGKCGHPVSGKIELRVNGEMRQSADLGLLIHPVAALIADLSKFYHLGPGDLIFTGTPEGVGPVQPGDRIEGSIEGVGWISLDITRATTLLAPGQT
jgi:fumarylpyruvate hydrolase